MAPRPPSRIPRANSTSTAPPAGSAADENAPPAHPAAPATRGAAAAKGVRVSAIPLAPATTATRSAAQLKSAPSSTRQSTTRALPVAHVVIQAPSSDPPAADGPDSLDLATTTARSGFHDERDDDGDHEQHHSNRTFQMPTPPNSQETSLSGEAVLTDQGDQGLLAPARATRRTRSPSSQPSTSRAAATTSSRRASRSPAVETVPDGPSHAPHILAARRRSSMSVSPHPPSTSTAAGAPVASTSAALSSTASAPTAKPKGKRTKLRPRASEILAAPLAAPNADDADGEIDPLLLLGPEQTRGRGEGRRKRGMAAQAHGRASYVPSTSAGASTSTSGRAARALEAGRAAAAAAARFPTPPATQEEDDDVVPVYQPLVFGVDEAAQGDGEDPADLGGFDTPAYYDDQSQVEAEPLVAHAVADVVEPAAQDDMDEEDEGGFAHLDEVDSSAGGYSSGDNGDANADAHLAAYSSASDEEEADAAPSSLYALGQIPTVRRTRPSYPPLSPDRTGEWDSTVAVDLGSSPPPPLREPTPGFGGARRRSVGGTAGPSAGARGRPSYPPLSPNTTGEFDSQCPVRLGSSPPPSPSGSRDGELDGEAARGRPASSEWRDEVYADVKVEDDVVDDAFLAPKRSTPAPSTSTSAARTASTSISTPSNLLFLSAFRSPSPAISPIPRPSGSSRSPQQPQLNFVSPRKTLDHLTNLVVPSPASARAHSRSPSPLAASSSSAAAPALAPARDPSPSQGPSASPQARSTWTRGPAFFRSSSFSPPAHAALPRTATLYARRPGQGEGKRNEDEADGEGSREYHRFADLTATSPMPVGEGEAVRDEHEQAQEEEREEEEVEVGFEPERLEREPREAGSLSRSASPVLAQSPAPAQDQDVGPPTPAKDRRSSPAAAAAIVSPPRADDDEAMASPASSTGSIRSRRLSLASPARSANGDVLMSSPSPRNSPVVAAFTAGAAQARSPGSPSPSVEHERECVKSQQLASTPGRRLLGGDDDDARMTSPSPARQGSPLKARIGELVGGGKTKLQGLLFGPRASTPRAPSVEVDEDARNEAQADGELSHEARVQEQRDGDDEPFQLQPAPTKAQRSRAPASVADSTFTSLSHSRSHASFASSTSTSTSHRRRRRPSHPTLPVIEITSTDPRAAARAAAILKVHHKYVEQGFTAVDAARAAASAFDAADAAGEQDGDSEDDEELRTLLLDAEEELREQAPHAARSASVSTAAPLTTTVAGAGARWTSHEWRKLEQALVELGRRQRRATSAASSSAARSMRSESIAMASVVGDECEPEQVVEAFLRSVGATREECVGEWAWDTLIIRVEALKARRGKDARQRRASSFASTSHAGSRRGPPASHHEPVEVQHPQALSSPSEEGANDEPTPEAHPVIKQEQLSDEDDSGAGSAQAESDESDEDGELADDTFFSSSKRDRSSRHRRGSVEPVYVPTALANPALRHLYDDFQPEKPKLPLKDILREDSPSSSSAAEEDEHRGDLTSSAPRESTPGAAGEPNEPPRSPSSAQRLMSYLGSFVRRSPAPAPSPASSTRALPADSSASPSPSPEMQQVQLSASLVTPRFASTAKPYPPLPASATHKPLPPVAGRVVKPLPHHRSDASTSCSTLNVVAVTSTANESTTSAGDTSGSSANSSTSCSSSRRRRRSSGEGNSTSLGRVWAAVDAIEEAESSREEEESRIIELLRSGSAVKRRAAGGDLRERTEDVSSASAVSGSGSAKGKGREASFRGFVELEEELGRGMIPSGARALDRRVSGERRVSRR